MSPATGANFQWRCPSCHEPLNHAEKQWRCDNNHCFDSAKEGYVNLLLAQHKKSQEPGDSKAMINARRDFLGAGFYAPLAIRIAELLIEHSTDSNRSVQGAFNLADAGCGEGYYLRTIVEYLNQQGMSVCATGIDISKPAVQKAAKRAAEHHYAVASCFDIPLRNESQHAVIQVFAPSSEEEINRILTHNGLWIQVNPAADHLFELKQFVYDSPQKHTIDTDIPKGFAVVTHTDLKFPIALTSPSQRLSLLMMTPFYWQLSEDKKATLLEKLATTHAHFDIRVLSALS